MAKNPHTELCKAVVKLALLRGHFVWVNNTGAGLMDQKRYVRFGYPGSGDIIGVSKTGDFISFECKTGEARQTFEQRIFQEDILRRLGKYFLIRSIDDAMRALDEIETRAA